MICQSCGADNRDAARFCATCGFGLARRCVRCDNELAASARFCDQCGSPADGSADVAERDVLQARKTVTIVFADLRGSTMLAERMDPEPVRALMDSYYAMSRDAIERFGGRVVKFIGDGMMAVFGIPDTAEDDVRRALQASLALHSGFEEIASELRAERGVEIGLRVGINTGEVVVSAGDDDVVGDAVNVAARLEQAAPLGYVFVGDATWRAARGFATFAAPELINARGKSDPVVARALLDVGPEAADTGVAFVGRDTDLGVLASTFADVVAGGTARLVTILGSPGVGKTRLAGEFAESLGDRAVVLVARCVSEGASALAPVADMLRIAASVPDTATSDEVVRSLAASIAADVPDRERVATAAAGLFGAAASTPEETLWSVRRLLETLAQAKPLLVVIEDVHWAEPMLLDLIEHLAEWTRAPVMLAAVARPELRELRGSLVDSGRHPVLALEGLDHESTQQLACAFLGTTSLPAGLAHLVPESTGGNPLFVRELLRMLVDDQILEPEDEGWRLRVSAGDIAVPPTIQGLLAARLDRLPADEQLVLERASIAGKEFPLGALHELAPSDRSRVVEVLDRLRKKELVEPDGTYWIDEPVWRFHHVLIREAAYRRLLRQHRAELHERLARWLTIKLGAVRGEHEEVVGYHLEQAYHQYRELGPLDTRAEDVGRDAAAHLESGAESALEREDLLTAALLAARALDCLPSGDGSRTTPLLVRCEALLALGEAGSASDAIVELRGVVGPDEGLEAWCACFDLHLATMTAGTQLRVIEQQAAEVARTFTRLGDRRGAAKAHTVRASTLARLGQYGEVETALDTALTCAREAGDRRLATVALAAAPVAALFGPSPVPRAGGRCLDVVRLVRITAGSPVVEATSQRCQALLEAFRGRDDAARRMIASARATLEELGVRLAMLETDLFAGMVELVMGDLDLAGEYLELAHDGLRALGAHGDCGRAAALLARVCFEEGDLVRAEALADEARELAGDDLQSGVAWRGVAAQVLAARGQSDQAVSLAEEAVSMTSTTDALVHNAESRFVLARVRLAVGDRTRGGQAAEEAADLYERKAATRLAASARGLVGATGDGRDGAPAHRDLDATRSATALRNRCVDAAMEWQRLFAMRDFAAMNDVFTPDFEHDDRRPILRAHKDRSESADEVRLLRESQEQVIGRVLAVRGERLALVESIGVRDDTAFLTDAVGVWELAPDGRIATVVTFDPKDLDGAVAELDRRFLAGEGQQLHEMLELVTSLNRAYNGRDWDTFRSTHARSYTFVDHRPAGWGTLVGVEEQIAVLQTFIDMVPDACMTMTAIHEASPDAMVYSVLLTGTSIEFAPVELEFHLLSRRGTSGLTRIETFPTGALDAAIAAFRGSAITPRNMCTGSIERMLDAFAAHDWSSVRAMFAARYDTERRQLLIRARGLDPVALLRASADAGARRPSYVPIAVRGERLALGRYDTVDESEFESSQTSVQEIDGNGMFTRALTYDDADLDGAFRELDEWYVEGEAARYAGAYRPCARFAQLHNQRDWDGLLELWAEDLVVLDHRPGGFGSITDRRDYLRLVQQFVAIAPDARTYGVSIAALRPHGSVALVSNAGTSADGSEVELWFVLVLVVDAGRITTIEHYPVDALDDAVARLDELGRAEQPSPRSVEASPVRNVCAQVFERLHDVFVAGDWDGYTAIVAPELAYLDRRPVMRSIVHGRAQFIDLMRGLRASGVATMDEALIATRGERLALFRTVTHGRSEHSYEVAILGIYELDGQDRAKAITIFDGDDMAAALDHLDERFLATEGGP
jgi:class 3 adenylate cyclase